MPARSGANVPVAGCTSLTVVRARPIALAALAAALALFAPAVAQADENPAGQPPFGAEPLAPLHLIPQRNEVPPGFRLSAGEAIAIADGAENVAAEREETPQMEAVAFTRGDDRWQISYFDGPYDVGEPTEVAQAVVDDRTGAVIEDWRDQQVEVKLARGYEDAVAGNVNEAWAWIPLCLLFFLPFFDPRRPFRLLHLDLLVLLAFSVSLFFFNKGEIDLSVPLVYPALGYLFVRMLIAGFRPRPDSGPLIPVIKIEWLAWGALALLVGRIAFNVIDSQVIDIGFAGVVGADRIGSGHGIYDGSFTPLIDRGDSYGPLNYLLYVPFEQLFPWHGGLEALPAAHAFTIFFDTVVVAGLVLVGRRLRAGAEGKALGVALAWGWLAYPFTLYALDVNGNDELVAAAMVAALLAFGSAPARGAIVALGSAAKFGPLGLAPLFAAGTGERRWRETLLFAIPFVVVWAVVLIPLLPDGGLREFYDRTFGYQASRGSPFSVWGLEPSLDGVQKLARALPVILGIAFFFLPKRRDVAPGRGAGGGTVDRDPGRLDALVLLLHPLVDAAGAGQHLRLAGADQRRGCRGCRSGGVPIVVEVKAAQKAPLAKAQSHRPRRPR